MTGTRLMPPAISFAPAISRRRVSASARVPGLWYSKEYIAAPGDALDRGDARAIRLNREQRARLYGHAVDMYRAGSALARVASDVGAGQPQVRTQELGQALAGIDFRLDQGAVYNQLHGVADR